MPPSVDIEPSQLDSEIPIILEKPEKKQMKPGIFGYEDPDHLQSDKETVFTEDCGNA